MPAGNPEAYGPAGPPPEAAPMGPPPPGMGPPMPEQGMGPPMPEAQEMEMGMAPPVPEKPYSIKAIQALAEAEAGALQALAGGAIPEDALPVWEPGPEAKGSKWSQPLPIEVFGPAVAFSQVPALGDQLEGSGNAFTEKYGFDPQEMVSDTELRKVTAQIKRMGKDKKLAKLLQQPMPGPDAMPEEPVAAPMGPPSAMTEEDEALLGAM